MNDTWLDDIRSIARALAVSPALLVLLLLGGVAVLLVAVGTHSRVVTVLSCLVGVVLGGIGGRAIAGPSRPFKIETLRQSSGMDYVNTTRRLGGFYVLAGVVWIIVTLSASAS